jgi:hypothetical protein
VTILACYAVAKDLASGQGAERPDHHDGDGQERRMGHQERQQMADHAGADDPLSGRCLLGAVVCQRHAAGMQSQEEVVDVEPVTVTETSVADLNAAIAQPAPEAPVAAPVEADQDELF